MACCKGWYASALASSSNPHILVKSCGLTKSFSALRAAALTLASALSVSARTVPRLTVALRLASSSMPAIFPAGLASLTALATSLLILPLNEAKAACAKATYWVSFFFSREAITGIEEASPMLRNALTDASTMSKLLLFLTKLCRMFIVGLSHLASEFFTKLRFSALLSASAARKLMISACTSGFALSIVFTKLL